MNAVQLTIRILVVILIVENGRCQNAFSDRDILRYQQMPSNEGQIEAITSYSTNIIQRDPSSQSVSSVSVQYHMADDANKNEDFNRADRAKKVYRIKNPFQQQVDDNDRQHDSNSDPQDSGTGASNQYAAVQYSLPPEEFLQQMRAETQHYQQQPQVSTLAPSLGYTATPQPQFQYSTIAASYDNNNQQSNQFSQLDPKATNNQYFPNANAYQFNAPFSLDSIQSTPSPMTSYLSTSLPNSQFVGTPTNPYVSSSSPIFLTSPPNFQQYLSSPLAVLQTGSPDYSNNRITTTIGSNSMSYDNNDLNKKIQIDHYDNSANGIRYPNNVQQLYQNEYASSTPTPTSSPYPDSMRDSWQNSMNTGVNALAKSLQEVSLTQHQNYPYNNQHDSRPDSNSVSGNSDTHRIGNLPSANNVYLNVVQPDYQTLSNIKSRTRDLEQETAQPEFYSNGDYGWKLTGKKPLINNNVYSPGNYQRYQQFGLNSDDSSAISHINFHLDTSKPYNYDQGSKSVSENEAQDFVKAAAKAHENLKQQQNFYRNNYASSSNGNNPSVTSNANSHYGNNDKQKNKYTDTSNSNLYAYSNPHPDLITASPYYYASTRENLVDNKAKPTFDHAKALKNIVPIDVSNVVSNSDSQQKITAGLESYNRYNMQNYGKDQADQNRQYYRPLTDSYYKDKNTVYGLNIKTKPEDYLSSESLKQFDPNSSYYGKQQQSQELSYNQGSFSGTSQQSYKPQISGNYQDSIQSSANIQQQGLQRPLSQMSTDFTSILKLNDVPYRLTQGLSSDSIRFHNNNNFDQSVSSPLPMRINQNVGSHQIDVTSNILNKLLLHNQPTLSANRPEIDSQTGGLMSTINGFKVANPYNVDLKLFAEMLKGKPAVDDSHMMSLRDQFNKPAPLKLDLSQLQFLLKNDNTGNLAPINDGFSAFSSPYLEIYNNGRFPYQGVKYSRSQEEEESLIPIADSSNNHPIGAVMEQDDPASEVSTGSDVTAQGEDSISSNFNDERSKKGFVSSNHRTAGDRYRHPNSLLSGRYSHQRQYPKSNIEEPYPLLKPPPPNAPRGRGSHIKVDRHGRRRRINKPRVYRIMKTEPLFEADAEEENLETVPTLLRPPPPVAEAKSDIVDNESSS